MAGEIDRVLVDTNVVSWVGGRRGPFAVWAAVIADKRRYVSFVTVGEILRGGLRAGWSEARTAEWEGCLRAYTVVPGTVDVARAYARVSARFFRQLSDNDLWIAATALHHGLPIASGDGRLREVALEFGILILTASATPQPPQAAPGPR